MQREKKGKATVLQVCPAAFEELLFKMLPAGARLQVVMKGWDSSFVIPTYR